MLRDLEMFNKMFQMCPKLKTTCRDQTDAIVSACCRHGRQQNNASTLASFVRSRNQTERTFATLAFLLMLKYESRDGIYAVVERMAVRVGRCESAKKQAYIQVVQKGAHVSRNPSAKKILATKWDHLLSKSKSHMGGSAGGFTFPHCPAAEMCSSPSDIDALNRVYEVVEDYLDDHKEKAFKSAMFEPCRLYFDLVNNAMHRDHVDVHGLNWFLVMIRGGLGVKLPLIPMDSEGDTIGFCHCWAGLHESKAWAHFADPENFGKSFEGIKDLRRGARSRGRFVKNRSLGGESDGVTRGKARTFAGGNCQVVERRCRSGDKAFKPYLDKFSYFFRREFLVRRMFEVMNSENKPEHVGFRKACDVLYSIYRQHAAQWAVEDSFLEHVYGSELTFLDIARTTAFFAWLGVCKPMADDWVPVPRGEGMIESKLSSDNLSTTPNLIPHDHDCRKEQTPVRTLADVNTELQEAMSARDIKGIKRLMRERAQMV